MRGILILNRGLLAGQMLSKIPSELRRKAALP